ncbi:hypothetical protein C8R44DRAFT_746175 [Mycena epipterygia]|nr:hypothetical protein C8R44DRAFT_746175 [Mycena epipterygia]
MTQFYILKHFMEGNTLQKQKGRFWSLRYLLKEQPSSVWQGPNTVRGIRSWKVKKHEFIWRGLVPRSRLMEFLTWKAKVICMNKMDPKKFIEREVRRENPRDYEVEWEVYKAQRYEDHQDELRHKVADACYVPAADECRIVHQDGCITYSPPVHSDPGAPQNAVKAFYLVTCPAARRSPGPRIYLSWTIVQRIVTGISHGGAVSYPSIQACLPAWHAGYDAGEHNHRASQNLQRANISASPRYMPQNPQTPRKPTTILAPASPSTVHGIGLVKSPAPVPVSPPPLQRPQLMPLLLPLPFLPLRSPNTYQTAATAGAASVCTMTDARTAAYFSAGHSMGQARAMAEGDRAMMMYEEWAEEPS